MFDFRRCKQTKNPGKNQGFVKKVGDDLLYHFRSTIGANGLNFSVRKGKRWIPIAIITSRS